LLAINIRSNPIEAFPPEVNDWKLPADDVEMGDEGVDEWMGGGRGCREMDDMVSGGVSFDIERKVPLSI